MGLQYSIKGLALAMIKKSNHCLSLSSLAPVLKE